MILEEVYGVVIWLSSFTLSLSEETDTVINLSSDETEDQDNQDRQPPADVNMSGQVDREKIAQAAERRK